MANKSDIKIIFVDIDWTLYDHKRKKFIKSGLKSLQKAHKNGVKVILASARPYFSMKGFGAIDALPNDGYISNCGAIAYTDNHYCLKYKLNSKHVEKVLQLCKRFDLATVVFGPTDAYLVERETDLSKRFFQTWAENQPRIDVYKGEEISSILVFATEEYDEYFKKLPIKFARFFDKGLNLYAADYSKGNGVKAILEYYGYSKDQAMAIGDDMPDIDMFKEVKYSIAMGNGKDECKKAALYVTDLIHKHGVKKALKEFKII